MPPQGTFAVPATVQAITRLVTELLVTVVGMTPMAEPGNTPDLHLFCNRRTTGSAYVAVRQQLLPLDDAWRRELARHPWPTRLPPPKTRVDPWEYDHEMYKRRNEVKRLFRRFKGFRRIFSRFDKLDFVFISFISFSLIADGLRLC